MQRQKRRRRSSKASLTVADKMSRLPDNVLHYILSLVSTKEAVATSILSKRWNNLWLSLPNIDFNNIKIDNIESNSRFNDSVYSVLVSRDTAIGGSHFINRFCLDVQFCNPHLEYKRSYPNVVKWINLVVQRRLKYLRLNLRLSYDDDDLHLDVDDYDNSYLPKLPITIFTCRTLVTIKFATKRDFILLLFGCPVLEDLKLFRIYLRRGDDSVAIQHFKTLSSCLPKLIRADITQRVCYRFLLKALSTSNSLRLDTFKLYRSVYQVGQPQPPYDDIPIFQNLTNLELCNRWRLVVQVLHHCPKLQNLKLYTGSYAAKRNEDDQENWVEPEFVPQCLLSHLRTCTLQFFVIRRKRMIAKYILKNANFLQCMTILSECEKSILSEFPKASATCQLLVNANI
ncbi:putative F-box domain, FBD domain, leucine-rich repeat domain, L domain-containing protein [Medicago truncatula]|uniref:Putative F-box domain, FBD domain, leucine-rich repeat domain, L domain-containing protein n=1 Tax=Medicago truncatula TaxID=3880 RepID=A0A396IKA4_MEDTR|nr:putative F-box domain, FBD domain, leucine-rich repeat domain, L domain-containing protein [Medicago truncatula]